MADAANFAQLPDYGVIPKAPLHGHVEKTNIGGASFGETLSNMLGEANTLMSAPERLSIEAVTTGNVDIHEVMIALGKSEVAFKLITAVTQKTVGAFDKLTSMQI